MRYLIAVFFSLVINFSFSQDKLRIVNGDLVVQNPDKPSESVWLYKNKKGQAELIQKQTTIESDSTKYFEGRNYAEAKGNVHILQDDSIDVYANEAFYFGNTKKSILKGEVALLKDFYTLQTEKLDYDLGKKIARYNTGGELSDTSSTLTSKKGTYYVDDNKAIFTDSVVLITPDRRIETEKLTYDMNDKWAYFEGETTIYEEGQIIKTKKGRYNAETGEAVLEEDPVIDNEENYIEADNLELTGDNGIGKATGNVYFRDKTNNSELRAQEVEQINDNEIWVRGNVDVFNAEDSVQLYTDKALINKTTKVTEAFGNVDMTSLKDSINLKAGYAKTNQIEETFFATENVILKLLNQDTELLTDTLEGNQKNGTGLAYGRPFLSTFNEGDSIYLTAKTFEVLQNIEKQDTLFDFIANKRVLLYKSDLQAKADSAYVNNRDSIITLFKNPVIWSDSTQMSADTIRIFLKKQTIDKVEFRSNCFFANLVDSGLYNQLKGKTMDAYFINGQIDSLHTNGNAETIFMVKDEEQAYVAIDELKSGKMNVSFFEGKIDLIYWYNQQEGTTHPFQDVNPTEFKLSGFAWREEEKPKSKEDLLIAAGRMEGDFKFIENSIESIPTTLTNSPGDRKDAPSIPKGEKLKGRPKGLPPK